ncbi:MAG: hypothetical protein HUJ83_10720 [Veillonella sp.]|nr:hypothetical protein [Veillonella sp.]
MTGLTDKENKILSTTRQFLEDKNAEKCYILGSKSDFCVCAEKNEDTWSVFYYERGSKMKEAEHEDVISVCIDLVTRMNPEYRDSFIQTINEL